MELKRLRNAGQEDHSKVFFSLFLLILLIGSLIPIEAAALPLSVNPIAMQVGGIGTPISFSVIANGGTAPYTYSLDANAPAWASIDSLTGIFSGIPDAVGAYNFNVVVSDSVGATTLTPLVIDVILAGANLPPVVAPIAAETANSGIQYFYIVSATDPDGDVLTYLLDANAPAGMTIDSTGFIDYPVPAVGVYNFNVIVSDGINAAVSVPFSLTINQNPQPPLTFSAIPAQNGITGVPLTFSATVSGGTAPYAYSLDVNAPVGATIDPATGIFSWTPTTPGTYNFNVLVDDSVLTTASAPVTITITDPTAPVISFIAMQNIIVGQTVSLTPVATNPNGGTLTWSLDPASSALGATIDPLTGMISFTPATSGNFILNVIVSDGIASPVSTTMNVNAAQPGVPMIAFTSPSNGETNVPVDTAISGVFTNFDIDVSSVNPQTYTVVDSLGNIVTPGHLHACPGCIRQSEFIPLTPLKSGETYTVTLNGVKSLSGNIMPTYTWSFTTAPAGTMIQPKVAFTFGMNGETNVPRGKMIKVVFNKKMDASTFNPTTFYIRDSLGNVVDGRRMNDRKMFFTITPMSKLKPNEVYTITLTTGIKDVQGQALAAPYTWSFTTEGVVTDTTAPVISIIGRNPTSIALGSTGYYDAGAKAIDGVDGDITSTMSSTNNVNTAVAGTYTVTYTSTDAALNTATATRTVNVVPLLDPLTITKYSDALVIPPTMPKSPSADPAVDYYEIGMRELQQQILPTTMPKTTVWGYGSMTSAGTFNYPSFTIEATANKPVRVKWINDLVDLKGAYLPHLLPVDQTLHWANPVGGMMGRDMAGTDPTPYVGPVPIVTHVHGAHTSQESDGYPEAWWLPMATNLPATSAMVGSSYDTYKTTAQSGAQWTAGNAVFDYPNDQRASTIWYHDHAMGMTRVNVYAGPAGFYLIRGGVDDVNLGFNPPSETLNVGVNPAEPITEIPIALQDRSFLQDGSLYYPDSRANFDGFTGPYAPTSDIAPIWNPEFFGDTMVVNGKTWPFLDVEQKQYRLRLLNGFQSRFVILKLDNGQSFTQIGSEGGFLPQPVQVNQILLGPAERADVIIDFTNIPAGTNIIMQNIAPDAPFSGGVPCPIGQDPITNPGCGDFAPANAATTGQVMQFRVKAPTTPDTSVPVAQIALPAIAPLGVENGIRKLSLNEVDSAIVIDPITGLPFGPKEAMLGTVTTDPVTGMLAGVPMKWSDPITENVKLGDIEMWELYDFTMDAHPMHLHLVQFQVVNREVFDPMYGVVGTITPPEPSETGWKDTVIVYPGQLTRVKARFDFNGKYVWHCHIVEHEDNEMMRPFLVSTNVNPITITPKVIPAIGVGTIVNLPITVTAPAGSVLTYSVGATAPAGTTFTNGILNVPTTGLAAGMYTFDLIVSDGVNSVTTSVTITVDAMLPVNNPPVVTPPVIPPANPTGTIVNIPVVAIDADAGTMLQYSLSGNVPAGIVLDPMAGAITGTPTLAGTYNFDLIVSDGINAVVTPIVFVVSNVVNPITVVPPVIPAVGPGSIINIPVIATPATAGTVLTYTLGATAPAGATFTNGILNLDTTGLAAGTYTFDIIISDGVNSVTTSVTITVDAMLPVNNPPVVTPPVIPPANPTGTIISIPVSAIDADAGTVLQYSLNGNVPAGIAIDPVTGIISGTPTIAGTYTFDLIVSDGVSAVITPITLVISAAGQSTTVAFTYPTTQAVDVPLDTSINAVFSSFDINITTVNAQTFIVRDSNGNQVTAAHLHACPGCVRQAEFIPAAPLLPGETYTATLDGVKTLAGFSVPAYTWSFTAAAADAVIAPSVAFTFGQNGETNVPVEKMIKVVFNKKMDVASINANTFYVTDSSGKLVDGLRMNDLGEYFVINSYQNLKPNEVYTGTLTTGIMDASGTPLAAPYTWSFTTGPTAIAPSIAFAYPRMGSTNVPLDTSINAIFKSFDIDTTTINAQTFIVKDSMGNQVTAAHLHACPNCIRQAEFIPAAPLLPGETYTATLTTGVKNKAGNGLVQPFSWTFTTAQSGAVIPPSVAFTLGNNGETNVPQDKMIKVVFNKKMDSASITSNTFYVTDNLGNLVSGYRMNDLGEYFVIAPIPPLKPDTVYTGTVTTGATDVSGTPLAAPYTWSFTTAPALPLTITLADIPPFSVPAGSAINMPTIIQSQQGAVLTYWLSATAPAGATFTNGVLNWDTTGAAIGRYNFGLFVSDGTNTASVPFSVNIVENNPAASITINQIPNPSNSLIQVDGTSSGLDITSFTITILDTTTGLYWDGTAWSNIQTSLTPATTIDSPNLGDWTYDTSAVAFVDENNYQIDVSALDSLGNVFTSTATFNYNQNFVPGGFIDEVTIESDNPYDNDEAKVGDIIYLSFTATEEIEDVYVEIAGRQASVTQLSAEEDNEEWLAQITVLPSDENEKVEFLISYEYEGEFEVSETTDDSYVEIDSINPLLESFKADDEDFKVNDEQEVEFEAEFNEETEEVYLIIDYSNELCPTRNLSMESEDGIIWNSIWEVDENCDGTALAYITARDEAGNNYTRSSNQSIAFRTSLFLDEVSIESNNYNSDYAKVGDIVTLNFESSEKIQKPVVTIMGHPAQVSGLDKEWNASYRLMPYDIEGNVSFAIDFVDIQGNSGIRETATTDDSLVYFDKTSPLLLNLTDNTERNQVEAGEEVEIRALFNEPMEKVYMDILFSNDDCDNLRGIEMYDEGNNLFSMLWEVPEECEGTAEVTVSGFNLAGLNYSRSYQYTSGINECIDEDGDMNDECRYAESYNELNKKSLKYVVDFFLEEVHIESDNEDSSYAEAGNTITLEFESTEEIKKPVVYIAGNLANVTQLDAEGYEWEAILNLTSKSINSMISSNVSFIIYFEDFERHVGIPVYGTTDGSFVKVNRTFIVEPDSDSYDFEFRCLNQSENEISCDLNDDDQKVMVFRANNKNVMEFNWNKSQQNLDMALVGMKINEVSGRGSFRSWGCENYLSPGQTKTIYLDRIAGYDSVCIKDTNALNISEVSSTCLGAGETFVACDGSNKNGYTCSIENGRYKITGLKHSAVVEQQAYVAPPTSGGSSSGGSRGSCSTDWKCTAWTECNNGQETRICEKERPSCTAISIKPVETQSCQSVILQEKSENVENVPINISANQPTESTGAIFKGVVTSPIFWLFLILIVATIIAVIILFAPAKRR